MYLKHIDDGTALTVKEDVSTSKQPFECNAVFFRLENDSTFWAGGLDLYNNAQSAGENTRLSICFFRGTNMYSFTGAVKGWKMEGRFSLVLVEQISGIAATSRREHDRNEMRRDVNVYGVDPDSLGTPNLRKASTKPDFSSEMFDISAGGMCLVSHNVLRSSSEPHFLLEFSLDTKSEFLLPAKLVRRGNCTQTALYRYDYGFEFDFSHAPEEKDRLVMGIFNARMSAFGGR